MADPKGWLAEIMAAILRTGTGVYPGPVLSTLGMQRLPIVNPKVDIPER